MDRRKQIMVIFVVAFLLLSYLFYTYISAPDEGVWPSLRGYLELMEVDNKTHSFLLLVNDTVSDLLQNRSNRSLQTPVSSADLVFVEIVENETHEVTHLIESSNKYTWEYIDSNNDGLINTGDRIRLYVDAEYWAPGNQFLVKMNVNGTKSYFMGLFYI